MKHLYLIVEYLYVDIHIFRSRDISHIISQDIGKALFVWRVKKICCFLDDCEWDFIKKYQNRRVLYAQSMFHIFYIMFSIPIKKCCYFSVLYVYIGFVLPNNIAKYCRNGPIELIHHHQAGIEMFARNEIGVFHWHSNYLMSVLMIIYPFFSLSGYYGQIMKLIE